jgi:hypothetical protein
VQSRLFDGIAGLEMRSSLVRSGETLEPGIVIANPSVLPTTLSGTYGTLFTRCTPWSSFLTLWLTQRRTNGDPGWEDLDSCSDPDLEELMVRIVRRPDGCDRAGRTVGCADLVRGGVVLDVWASVKCGCCYSPCPAE